MIVGKQKSPVHLNPLELVMIVENIDSPNLRRKIETHCPDCPICKNLVDKARQGIMDEEERKWLAPCFATVNLWKEIQKEALQEPDRDEILGYFSYAELPCAAGTSERIPRLPWEMLKACGLPDNTSIICNSKQRGYEIYIQSSVPVKLTLEFYREESLLYRTTISSELPDVEDYVPYESIEGWTDIRLIRKQN